MSTRVFWPPAEAAQADYEMLRARVLETGSPPAGPAAARFARRGLAGLIAWPAAGPAFRAELTSAPRPPWTPHADPREQALAAAYEFLLDAAGALAAPGSQAREGWP
jgi:hypothetical protein